MPLSGFGFKWNACNQIHMAYTTCLGCVTQFARNNTLTNCGVMWLERSCVEQVDCTIPHNICKYVEISAKSECGMQYVAAICSVALHT